MKKRFVAFLLVLIMVLGLLPVSALAGSATWSVSVLGGNFYRADGSESNNKYSIYRAASNDVDIGYYFKWDQRAGGGIYNGGWQLILTMDGKDVESTTAYIYDHDMSTASGSWHTPKTGSFSIPAFHLYLSNSPKADYRYDKNFELNYNANGGEGAPEKQTATSKNDSFEFDISDKEPTREGHTFKGWSDTATGSAAYQPGGKITVTGKKTIYAVWEENTPPTPDKPLPPTEDDIRSNLWVTVVCTTNRPPHEKLAIALFAGDYTIADTVNGDAVSGYTCEVTVQADKYIVQYGRSRYVENGTDLYYGRHRLVAGEPSSKVLTLIYANGTWTIPANGEVNFNVECDNTPPTDKPGKPGEGDFEKAGLVSVECSTKPADHAKETYDLKNDTFTIGEVEGNATDGYTCEITVTADSYVSSYVATHGAHTLTGDNTKKFTLTWVSGKWDAKEGGVTFPVQCSETPVAPEKPTALDGSFAIVCKNNEATHGSKTDYIATPSQYTISDVQKDEQGYYVTATVKVAPNLAEYNARTGAEHRLVNEQDATLTITFRYDTEATGKWTQQGKQQGELPVVEVTCKGIEEPTRDDIFNALTGLVTVTCVNRVWYNDDGKLMDCGEGRFAAKAGIVGQDYTLVKGEDDTTWVVTFPVTNFVKSFKQDPAHHLYTKDTLSWYIRWENNAWTSGPVESGVDDLVKLTHAPTNWREVAKIATGGKDDCIHVSCVNGETGVCDYGITVPFVYSATDVVSVEPDVVPGSYIATFKVNRYIDTCAKACNDKNFPDAPRTHKLLTHETVQWKLYATTEADEKIGNEVLNHVWAADPVKPGTDDVCTIAHNWVVTFDSNGGSDVAPMDVEYEGKATAPAAPTRTGFTFDGWYLGEAEKPFDFDNTTITSDITLTAKWEINKFKVTFDTDGGEPIPADQFVEWGLFVEEPTTEPTKTGYTFTGWYLGDEKYDFSAAVEQNITLTAKWSPATVYLFVRPVDSKNNLLTGTNALLESTLEKAGFTGGYNASDKQYITVGKMTTKHVLPTYPAATVITDGKLLLDVVNELGDYYSTYDKHEDALGFNAKDQDGLDWYKLEYMPATSTHYGYEGQSEAYHLNGLLKFYYTAYENGLPDGSTETVDNMPKNNYGDIYDYYIFNNRFTLPTDVPTRDGYTFLGWKAQEINNGGAVAYANRGSELYMPGETYGDEYSGIRNDVVFTAQWEKNLNVEITDISYDTWPRFLGDTFTVTAKADDPDAVVTLDYDLDGARPFELTDTTKNADGSYTFTFKVVQITAANYNPRSNGEFFTATATKGNVTATDTDAKEINLRNRVHLTLLESGGTTGDETPVDDATVVIENIYMPGATKPMPYDAANKEYRTKDWDISNGDDGKIIIRVNGQTFELTTDVKGRDIRTVLKEGKEEVYATYTIQAYSFVGALMVNGTKASYYSGDRAFGKYGEAVNIGKLVTDAIARVKSDAVDGPNNPSKVEIKITRPGKAAANGEITAAQFGVGVTNNNDTDLTQPWLRPDSNLFRSEVWYNATTFYDVTFVDSVDTSTEYGVNEDVKWNTTTSALANEPTKTGYTFVGWYKDAACETPFDFTTETITKATTLYAKWKINQYTITFDTKGGTAIAPITQDYGTAVTAPANPTKTGYTFDGWDTAIPTTMPAENMTITAQWTINQYTITFDTKGGTAIAPITQDYATAVTAPANPTKTGYTFAGWDKTIPTTMPAENMTITAQWKINQYTITFDTKGGTAIAPITQDYGTAVTAPANPTKTGYTFAGWDKAVPATMPAENMTITAQWTINYYPFVFDSQGGSEVKAQTIPYLGTAIKPADPTRAGYWFNGWYTDKTFKTKYNFSTPVTGPTTVYAGWTMIVLPSTITKKTPKLNTADHFAYVQGYPDGTVKPAGNITRAETAAILFRLMDDTSRNNYYSTKSGFRDVAAGSWYNTYVATLNNAGVITDSANGYFRPNDAITRAELAAMLAAFTDTTRAANYFNDVTANYWAANAIAVCAKLGWINGYPDGSFRPDRNVTRAELMAMINRATGRAPKSADAFLPGMKTWSDNTADKWYYLDVQEATNSHSYTVRPTEIWTAITAAPNWSKYE